MRIGVVQGVGVVLGGDHRQFFAVVAMTPEILFRDLAKDPGEALRVLFLFTITAAQQNRRYLP